MLKSSIRTRLAFAGVLPLAVAAALAAAPAPASAETLVVTQVVDFDDLDLTKERGVATLKRRVAQAVTRVCGSEQAAAIAERQAYRACADVARADAQTQIERAVQVAHMTRALPLTTARR